MVLQQHLPACTRTATELFVLDADSAAGRAYLADVAIARAYAAANRRALAVNPIAIGHVSLIRDPPMPQPAFNIGG